MTHTSNPANQEGVLLRLKTADGCLLGGFIWQHGDCDPLRPIVVIASATSVRCRYYSRFAGYLFAHGFDVLTFDYRGIGVSTPKAARGVQADWVDWGQSDLEAALHHALTTSPERPVYVIGHSIGGFAIGAAPSASKVKRILTVGSQYAYWRDYDRAKRWRMYVKWHLFMPTLTALFGYFPARRLGWMEDTPSGVVRDWSRMKARFEDSLRPGRFVEGKREADLLRQRFSKVTTPILAIGLEDDPHGTVAAIDRLLAYFTSSPWCHWRIAPADIGGEPIGHFAFFHDRFKSTLWPIALEWLRLGQLPADAPGKVQAVGSTQPAPD